MRILLGADSLCWHLRLERGGLTLEAMLEEAAAVEVECLQLNLHHARKRDLEGFAALAERARELGFPLLASGDFLGQALAGDTVDTGVRRVEAWLERANALGSPLLRVVSGFYRAELAGRPDAIEAERRHVAAVLRQALPAAQSAGVVLAVENHSDFTSEEYRALVDEIGREHVGVFLDLINPVSALEDPVAVVARLAPLAVAGHVKDYTLRSLPTDDGYHRRGFEVLWRYPGEGVADLPALVEALVRGATRSDLFLTVEGLDNRADVADQRERLSMSLGLLRGLVASATVEVGS